MKCKACGKKFHWCTSCGYDRELHPLSEGCCSCECLQKRGGEQYDEGLLEVIIEAKRLIAEPSETPVDVVFLNPVK